MDGRKEAIPVAEDDADLRSRLRGADPAARLPDLDAGGVAERLALAAVDGTEARAGGTHGRSRLTWLVAAAAAVVVAGTSAAVLTGGDDEPPAVAPASPDAGAEPSAGPVVPELTLPTGAAGRCMVPDARGLASAAFAAEGEVTQVEDGEVRLDVLTTFAGEDAEEVRVAQSSADLTALIGAPRFEEGERYLVAGTDEGEVMVCGFSGPWTPRLARLYDRAFGTPTE